MTDSIFNVDEYAEQPHGTGRRIHAGDDRNWDRRSLPEHVTYRLVLLGLRARDLRRAELRSFPLPAALVQGLAALSEPELRQFQGPKKCDPNHISARFRRSLIQVNLTTSLHLHNPTDESDDFLTFREPCQ